jgi:hypothetical protein
MSQYIEEVGYAQETVVVERRQGSRRAAEDRRRQEVIAFLDSIEPPLQKKSVAKNSTGHVRRLAVLGVITAGVLFTAHVRHWSIPQHSRPIVDTELMGSASYKWARFHRVADAR